MFLWNYSPFVLFPKRWESHQQKGEKTHANQIFYYLNVDNKRLVLFGATKKKNSVCIEAEWYRHFRFESEQSEKWMFILQWAHKRNRGKKHEYTRKCERWMRTNGQRIVNIKYLFI